MSSSWLGDRAPVGDRVAPAADQLAAQPRLRDQPLELARQGDGVAGREQQAALAIPDQLLVEREAGGDRDRPGGERLANQAGSHPGPAGGDADDVGCRDQLLGRRLARADGVDPVAQPARDADLVPARAARPPPPSQPQRQAAERSEEEPQRAALLLEAEGDPHGPLAIRLRDRVEIPAPRPPALHSAVGTRRDQLVGAGKEALHQVRGGAAARRARVEPAEEDLDQRPRHLGGEDALGRLVEAADVERARVAKRDRGRAGRERIVHVDDVELDPAEQLLERAAEVDRHRGRARGRAARHRQARAHRQHRRPAIAAGPSRPSRSRRTAPRAARGQPGSPGGTRGPRTARRRGPPPRPCVPARRGRPRPGRRTR